MAKVTSKRQVTIPKRVADALGIRPGDELDWVAAGDVARVSPRRRRAGPKDDRSWRLALFDAATARQRKRDVSVGAMPAAKDRGWRREDLYRRGSTR